MKFLGKAKYLQTHRDTLRPHSPPPQMTNAISDKSFKRFHKIWFSTWDNYEANSSFNFVSTMNNAVAFIFYFSFFATSTGREVRGWEFLLAFRVAKCLKTHFPAPISSQERTNCKQGNMQNDVPWRLKVNWARCWLESNAWKMENYKMKFNSI